MIFENRYLAVITVRKKRQIEMPENSFNVCS